jgi:hypothetical protein
MRKKEEKKAGCRDAIYRVRSRLKTSVTSVSSVAKKEAKNG